MFGSQHWRTAFTEFGLHKELTFEYSKQSVGNALLDDSDMKHKLCTLNWQIITDRSINRKIPPGDNQSDSRNSCLRRCILYGHMIRLCTF